jgi:predicted negative regulator of RcsB-dependent stress response
VDTQARHALKKDSFAQATATSVSWISGHRSGVVRYAIVGLAVVVVGIGSLVAFNVRTSGAEAALGAALDTYSAPLAQPGAPQEKDVYATSADRSKAANQQFVTVADQYGWLAAGVKAHYFAGVTYRELGNNPQAEAELKTAAASWNRNLSNLAKLALAGLYHQSSRDAQAIELYNNLSAKPSDTVSASVAKLDLADLYAESNQLDKARTLWAAVKDADKEGISGQIATEKLAGK